MCELRNQDVPRASPRAQIGHMGTIVHPTWIVAPYFAGKVSKRNIPTWQLGFFRSPPLQGIALSPVVIPRKAHECDEIRLPRSFLIDLAGLLALDWAVRLSLRIKQELQRQSRAQRPQSREAIF